MAEQPKDAWEEVRKIHREHWFFYQISFGGFLVFVIVLIGAAVFGADRDYLEELFMQALGIIITVLVLDRLAQRREEQREEKALQERLVMEVCSQSNETAKRAVHELHHHGWLRGENGRLQGANLWAAKLQGVNLWAANLQAACLERAELQKANLEFANLRRANLREANLRGADLRCANLQGADLWGAHLDRAALRNANLQEAHHLSEATFDEQTTLPDGSMWTADTDLARFTDANHPQFWRSDDHFSPACRHKPSSAS